VTNRNGHASMVQFAGDPSTGGTGIGLANDNTVTFSGGLVLSANAALPLSTAAPSTCADNPCGTRAAWPRFDDRHRVERDEHDDRRERAHLPCLVEWRVVLNNTGATAD
jgi:hypothetical protein